MTSRSPDDPIHLRRTRALALGFLLPLLPGASRAQETPPPAAEPAPTNEELARRIEILTQELEALKHGDAAATAAPEGGAAKAGPASAFGLGPAASKVYRVTSGLSIGGYGEVVYQNFDSEREDGAAAGKTNEWDMLRAVVYLGWKFSPTFVLNSEIEYEHASTGKGGEVSVEFLTLDALLSRQVNLRAGLLLVPMGLVNELHEPTAYLGARRPEVESRILPSTWRANGVGAMGDLGPFAYKLYLTESLNASGYTAANGLRGGRQNGARALADNLAVTGRLDLVTVPGLLVGGSFFTGKSGKDVTSLTSPTSPSGPVGVRTTAFDVHADYRVRGLWLRGVLSSVSVDDVAALNRSLGLTGKASVGEEMGGWYLQAGYEVWGLFRPGASTSLTPFVRYEWSDTQSRVPSGWQRDPANDRSITTFGLDFKPIPQLVVKVDYQDTRNEAKTGVSQWNVGIGYIF